MNTEMKKTVVYSTGDKILNIMKEQDMDIPELSLRCGVREDVLMDILAGIREADISTLCKIADGLEICVRELCPDEESYVVPVEKDILAKLIVISELKEMELEELIGTILENGIEEHGWRNAYGNKISDDFLSGGGYRKRDSEKRAGVDKVSDYRCKAL